jgi:hypothetical protein
MDNASPTAQRGIYLRDDALDRIFSPMQLRTLNLTKQQQAILLGIPYANFWRLIDNKRRATGLNIADILLAAERIASRWDGDRLRFDDLFEVRTAP